MQTTFLSIVLLIDELADRRLLLLQLPALHAVTSAQFSHYEYIVINNCREARVEEDFAALDAHIRPHLHLIQLSSHTDTNHAWLAGLDRANGDYTLLLESQLLSQPQLLGALYQKSQAGFDLVYVRATSRKSKRLGLFYRLFYWIMRHYSSLEVDELAHHSRIISRRALNALLRMRENLRYMKAVYSLVGFPTSYLEVDSPLQSKESFEERFRTSLLAITSYTTFLRTLMGWIVVGSFVFLLLVVLNALRVRFVGLDLFGHTQEAVSGWTYLVVLIAVFFAVVSLQLYLVSIYLSNIYQEIKQRPLYTIESIRRF